MAVVLDSNSMALAEGTRMEVVVGTLVVLGVSFVVETQALEEI